MESKSTRGTLLPNVKNILAVASGKGGVGEVFNEIGRQVIIKTLERNNNLESTKVVEN